MTLNNNKSSNILDEQGTPNELQTTASPTAPEKITVQVNPKNITLPINTATLTAFPIPDAPKENPYSYEWTLIDDKHEETGDVKKRAGVMDSKNEQRLKLSKLEEGTYQFKVTVTGTQPVPAGSKGEAFGVITVFPGR